MLRRLLYLLLCLDVLSAYAQTGVVRGTVRDANGGEALNNVAVQLTASVGTVSGATGQFAIETVASGDYTLTISTVGYHVVKRAFHLDAGETKEFEIVLSSDNMQRTDTVEVTAGPFETARQDSPDALVLSGNDMKNLASVLADDPLRAVSGLPGVSSNNDFDARFSLRGADYSRVGLYLDNILLHEPFHMLQGQNVTGSGTAFNGAMIEELELHEGAPPERFQNRSGGVLDVHLRDGNRSDVAFQIEASASNAGVIAEGPLGKKKRGSWMIGARKSYLQYLVDRILSASSNGTSLVFGLEDVQGRLTYDLNARNNVSLYILESYSDIDRAGGTKTLGINSLATGSYNYSLANAGWRYTPSPKVVFITHAAWMREKYDNFNTGSQSLGHGFYSEWTGNTNASWIWSPAGALDAGFSVRETRDWGNVSQYQSAAIVRLNSYYDGTAHMYGGFVQQSWNAWKGRLHLTGGVRSDRHSVDGVAVLLPSVSASLALTRTTRLQLGYGQYAQYPEISVLDSIVPVSRRLLPLRSNQSVAALEQRLSERMRVRVELYDRADRDLPYRPTFDPRMVNGLVVAPPANPAWTNSERGYARGAEVYLQRTSANGFDGWVSYAYGRTGDRDGVSGARFPSDYDQRHTVNVFASQRITPSVNVSMRFSYGNGFPIPGYLAETGATYFLAAQKNQLTMPYYQRTDLRVNKSWTRKKWKIALYGEIINITNRTNVVFDSLNSYNTKTGQTSVTLDSMMPIIPSAGLLVER